jgi:hypothetical protein
VPEGEQSETVYLNEHGEELGTVVHIGTGNDNQNDKNYIPPDLSDDDEIIDYFLMNNDDWNTEWAVCKYF